MLNIDHPMAKVAILLVVVVLGGNLDSQNAYEYLMSQFERGQNYACPINVDNDMSHRSQTLGIHFFFFIIFFFFASNARFASKHLLSIVPHSLCLQCSYLAPHITTNMFDFYFSISIWIVIFVVHVCYESTFEFNA